MARSINIYLNQGETFYKGILAKTDQDAIIDLAGYTAQASFKKSPYSSDSFTFDTSVSGTTGYIDLKMGATTTALVTEGKYVYDVIAYTDTNKIRITQGMVFVDPAITT